MLLFLKTLIVQNLKLKSQNKTVGCDLCYFFYVFIKNYHISILFICESISWKINVSKLSTIVHFLQALDDDQNKVGIS